MCLFERMHLTASSKTMKEVHTYKKVCTYKKGALNNPSQRYIQPHQECKHVATKQFATYIYTSTMHNYNIIHIILLHMRQVFSTSVLFIDTDGLTQNQLSAHYACYCHERSR